MGIEKVSETNHTRHSPPRKSLIDSLFTSTQKKVLGLLFASPDRSFFTTEVIQLTGGGSGAIQRELQSLSEAGIVNINTKGKQKYYQANKASPIFEELHSIILKTVGLTEPLKEALENLRQRIDLALIYGSIAKGTDTAASDIDLLIVSQEVSLAELYDTLTHAEETLGRKINPTLYTRDEFRSRIENKNSFVSKVLSDNIIVLLGEINAFTAP